MEYPDPNELVVLQRMYALALTFRPDKVYCRACGRDDCVWFLFIHTALCQQTDLDVTALGVYKYQCARLREERIAEAGIGPVPCAGDGAMTAELQRQRKLMEQLGGPQAEKVLAEYRAS